MMQQHVEVAVGVGRKGLPKMLDQFTVECADLERRDRGMVLEGIATSEINGGRDEALIHWECEVPIASDTRPISERLVDRLSQGDTDVFGGVVVVNVQVTLGDHVQIDQRMFGKQVQHVIEESNAAGSFSLAVTIKVDGQLDIGLTGRAVDGCRSVHAWFPVGLRL